MAPLTEGDIEDFHRDGAVCLRGVFDHDWLEKVARGIEINLEHPSLYSERLRTEKGTGYYFNDYCNWQKIEEFKDFAFNSPAAETAGKLMNSKTAVFYHEHVLTKDPDTYKVTPWHHDQAYYPIDGFKNCSIWMPLDPIDLETTIRFVQGSHRWNRWFYPRKFVSEKNYVIKDCHAQDRKYEDVPDVDGHPEQYNILKWEVNPGDCVVFHMMTLHAAPANKGGSHRRVLSTRWLGDDCVFAKRPWTVSPPIDGGLNYGDRVICDTFPLAWGAAP